MDFLSILLLVLIGLWIILAVRHIVKSGTSCCGSKEKCCCENCKKCTKEIKC